MKPTGLGILIAVALAASAPEGWTATRKMPSAVITPAGFRQATAVYVKMPDGVEIAVNVLLPPDLKPGERVPVLMRTTRYWRAPKLGWGLRLLIALHRVKPEDLENKQRVYFNQRRFAVIVADARGSGASGGSRATEYSAAEIADLGEVAAWAARQPWSNGRVGTFGVSYDGNDAELAAVPNQPAIRAVMPLYDDFDSQALLEPGGVYLKGFLQPWSDLVAALDRNDTCQAQGVSGWSCWKLRLVAAGVQPVDADPDGRHLAELVKRRHNLNVAQSVGRIEFRDDALVTPEGTIRFEDLSPYGQRKRIAASGVPMMVWCGWMDANPCEGALARYQTLSNPQIVVIGPLSHGGSFNADPFAAAHRPAVPPVEKQYEMEADFFDRLLRGDAPEKIESEIRYYTMGEAAWHTTKIWPPAGLEPEKLYLAAEHALSGAAPDMAEASDSYRVDFTATSGERTRWHTQLGGGDVVYPDRAEADRKLLTYTSAPLTSDVEITGSPILSLALASTAGDGAIHAYLEDMSPEGRVTYLDEGLFRVIHRKEVDPQTLPYRPPGPAHSFLRTDAEPLRPGEVATIRFALLPTSIVLRQGHRIRLALAGADQGLFQRYPAAGTPVWTVHRDREHPSFLELPMRKR
jgi:putative CocE/NonD family hydrolase